MAEYNPAEENIPTIPNPRRPLTKVPTPPPEPTTQRLKQQQQEYEEAQSQEFQEPIPQVQVVEEEKPFFTDEYDEDRELRAKSMPTIYSFANPREQLAYMYGSEAKEEDIVAAIGPIKYREGLKQVLTTPNFNIRDIHIKDVHGKNTIGTFAVIWINPFAQVLPLHIKSTSKEEDTTKQKRIIYEILFGQGQLVIGNLTKRVMKSDIFWVEPGIEHNFFNTTNQPLVIRLFYDGHVDLRDRYFPKARANEVAKESRREIFNVQKQGNVPVTNTKEKHVKSEDKFA